MIRQLICFILVFFPLIFSSPQLSWSQQSARVRYSELMQLGKQALYDGRYKIAQNYFTEAQSIRPYAIAPTEYLDFIKRMNNGMDFSDEEVEEEVVDEPTESVDEGVAAGAEMSVDKIRSGYDSIPPAASTETFQEPLKERRFVSASDTIPLQPKVIELDDLLWATQPRTLIQVEFRSNVILRGNNIERFLVITPGTVEIQQLNRDEVNVIALNRGSTVVHLWDSRGRWTFNVEVILPVQPLSRAQEVLLTRQTNVRPLRLSYYSDWSTYNSGRTWTDTERQSLNYVQTIKAEAETPYGYVDSWVVFNKFAASTEATGYGIGLFDGHIGKWRNFNIKAFDTSKTFSPLTMPGQYLRGIVYEQRTLNDNVDFAYVRGRDRATYGFLAPGVLEDLESFVEGAKVTLFSQTPHRYSLNFARGWGKDRPDYLNEQTYSVQTDNRFGRSRLENELAFDESDFAKTSKFTSRFGNLDWGVSFRDIDEEFTTVTNLPSNQGEIGGTLNGVLQLGDARLNSVLDFYQDRLLPNPDDPDAINVDFSSFYDVPISSTDRWGSSIIYTHTPGELSPRKTLRLNTNYSKRLEWWENHPLTALLGGTFQRSRYELSPTSDYDRHAVLAGIRVPIIKNFDYFLNYEWSWVTQQSTNEDFTPSVLNTGFNYSYRLTKAWGGDVSFIYRDEQQADGLNSFLAGEDSVTLGLGLNYRPANDWEFFTDGRARNVWRESDESVAFNEFDIHWGVRASWDTPIFWNPQGIIYGTIYKDKNGNAQLDSGEEGVGDVVVNVGDKKTTTNRHGHYAMKVRAKTVFVSIDVDSLPKGFVFSDVAQKEVAVDMHQWTSADFAVTTQSGIFGIVYEDINGSGKPDEGDQFIQRVKITLDDSESTLSEYDGSYFFRNTSAGKHTIKFDVNSFPKEYIPTIKVRHEFQLEEGATYVLHIPVVKK